MPIAILGATSQIARDLILSCSTQSGPELHLFARRPEVVRQWLTAEGMPDRYPVEDFTRFAQHRWEAVLNFVGIGDPAQAMRLGPALLDITAQFDGMVLDHLQHHPDCRYLFLSSGAAYGGPFDAPVTRESPAIFPVNDLSQREFYGVAKLYAECRHRTHPDWAIVDLRVFSYFSHTQDLSSRFFMADILRAIRDGAVLDTSPDYIVRDYLHPADFFQLVQAILTAPASHGALDCYSRAPIDKPALLAAMQEHFGLRYRLTGPMASANATGVKPHYYSLDRRAAAFGYQPGFSSLEGILQESAKLVARFQRPVS
ncbi:MAG: NAD-dependent epimerase/dehydratase family protein [Magnetococcus sp. MYC-9]